MHLTYENTNEEIIAVKRKPRHQPASAITMLQVMYLWLPFVFEILITILLSKMNVEAANEKLRREKGIE